MKKLFFILIIHCNLIPSELPILPESTEANPYTINFNINLSNISDASSANDIMMNAQQNQKLSESKIDAAPILIPAAKSIIFDGISAYKWHITAAIAVGSYGLLCYFIMKGDDYLKRTDLWSSYRKELSLDEILAIPQKQFAQDLLREVQRRYNANFATSLMLFIKAIDQEESNIRWYRSFYDWISYLHINKLVLIDTEVYKNCAQQLQQLAYYKGCIDASISAEEN